MSLVCVPTIYCQPGKAKDLAKLLPIKDSLDNQAKTLAYYFFSPSKSPDTLIGFELYQDRSGLKEHGTASSFKEFGKASSTLVSKPFTLSQAGPVCGFLTKNTESAATIMQDMSCIAVMATIFCQSAEHRIRFLEEAGKVIANVEKEEGTLSYYWAADTTDLTKVYVFERYASAEAAQLHSKNARPFMKATKDLVKSATIEAGSPVGGFLKKVPSLMDAETNPTSYLAPPLASTQSLLHESNLSVSTQKEEGSSREETNLRDVSFTRARRGVPQSIAHRGYKTLFPENTMIALEGALKSGADGIETDVHLSKDGVVVIAHDASTLRCYGKPGNVWEQDFHGPAGMNTFVTVDEPFTKMPTLREVLLLMASDAWSDKWLLLDVKVDNQVEVIRAMADTMDAVNSDPSFWSARVVLGIWHHQYLPFCAEYLPGLPITHIGLHTAYARRYFLHHPAVSAFNLQINALVTHAQQRFVKEAHDAGKPVYLWTVNDAQAMRFCMHLGVDAILSDDPSKTRQVQGEDLTRWHPQRDFWTWKRTAWGYLHNVLLFFVMLHRIFWRFRTLRTQPYLKPQQSL